MDFAYIDEPFVPLGSGLPRSDPAETGKLHLTSIVRYIRNTIGRGYKDNQWDLPMAGEVGFMWEDVLSKVYGDRFAVRLEEIEFDGIVGSPDGLGPDTSEALIDGVLAAPGQLVLEEYKCTWRSSNRMPTDNWDWMAQVKSYLHMLGLKSRTVIFRILYLMGNYKGSGPQYRVARIQFTPEELYANWQMILQHAKEMRQNGAIHNSD